MNYLKPPIVLLKNGTDASQGKAQIVSNINACCAIVDIVRTTLGPRGMDKLIHNGTDTTVTNDGATVLQKLNVAHPAAKLLVDIAKAQDMEVGDGTTSVTVLCGEFLSVAKDFIEEGVVPQTIIKGYDKAAQLAVAKLNDLAVDLTQKSKEEKAEMLRKCAETTLTSKLVADYKEFFADQIVRAVEMLGEDLSVNAIGIKKVTGGSVTDSMLVDGVAFKKTFSYAGFEQQPKRFENAKVLLLNIELELKAEKDNAEVRISDPDQYKEIVDAEWNIIYEKLEAIATSGAQVVLSKLAIGDLATQYFADRNIFCAGRVERDDMERTRRATGGVIQSTVNGLTDDVLGSCGLFEEVQIGGERFNIFHHCPKTSSATMILRGGAQQFVDEAERSIHDAIMIVRRAILNTRVVGGGGAIEMEISRYLREYARTIPGKQQRVINAYAKALEVIPRSLALNSGADTTDIVNKLRAEHAKGMEGRWMGVDCIECTLTDTMRNFIWEPVLVKENALYSATEAACMILSIDETVKNPQSEQQGAPKGKGKGSSFTSQMANMAMGGKGKGMRQLKGRG